LSLEHFTVRRPGDEPTLLIDDELHRLSGRRACRIDASHQPKLAIERSPSRDGERVGDLPVP
jgi:hypothetical protein